MLGCRKASALRQLEHVHLQLWPEHGCGSHASLKLLSDLKQRKQSLQHFWQALAATSTVMHYRSASHRENNYFVSTAMRDLTMYSRVWCTCRSWEPIHVTVYVVTIRHKSLVQYSQCQDLTAQADKY